MSESNSSIRVSGKCIRAYHSNGSWVDITDIVRSAQLVAVSQTIQSAIDATKILIASGNSNIIPEILAMMDEYEIVKELKWLDQ